MKKCFVTGGSGFVGRYLIPELRRRGYTVLALARSTESARVVRELGAMPVPGDLDDLTALREGMRQCDVVFHLAAAVDFGASAKELHHVHVEATALVLQAAREADVRHFLYLGAASVVADAGAVHLVDETFKARQLHDGYSLTKLQAENLVLQANCNALKTYSVRPPLIWGVGFSALPEMKKQVESGQFRFIDGGLHPFSTSHVRNVCEALLLVYEKSPSGQVYFVTDGDNWTVQHFMTRLFTACGLPTDIGSMPRGLALVLADVMGVAWWLLGRRGLPPLTRTLVYLFGKEFTVSDAKLRQLGFRNVISIEEGLAEFQLQPVS